MADRLSPGSKPVRIEKVDKLLAFKATPGVPGLRVGETVFEDGISGLVTANAKARLLEQRPYNFFDPAESDGPLPLPPNPVAEKKKQDEGPKTRGEVPELASLVSNLESFVSENRDKLQKAIVSAVADWIAGKPGTDLEQDKKMASRTLQELVDQVAKVGGSDEGGGSAGEGDQSGN